MQSLEVAGRLSISYSAARQLFVYTKNSTRKCYANHNTIKHAKIGPRLQLHTVRDMLRKATGCVASAVSFSGFHSGPRLICCTD